MLEAGGNQFPRRNQWAVADKEEDRIETVPEVGPPYRVMSGGARIGARPVLVQVARSEGPIAQNLNQLIYILFLGLPGAVAVAGLGGYLLARRGLAPLDRMAGRAPSINAGRLEGRLA